MKPRKTAQFSEILGVPESTWQEQDESEIQRNHHRLWRALAMKHMATSEQTAARAFRGECYAGFQVNYQDFLKEQGKPGAWGTYLEATALAELCQVTLVVTPIKDGQAQEPICLYRAPSDAPVIHLYNRDNQHWYVNGRTHGEGNCLYNAFAQAAWREIQSEQKPEPKPANIHAWRLFDAKSKNDVLAHQKAIESAIEKAPTEKELKADFEKETLRITALPAAEKNQIKSDYEYALRLATEEMNTMAPSAPVKLAAGSA